MAPLNLGERLTLATEALRLRASRATTVLGPTRAALDSRKVVDQATGMLMHGYNLNREAALEVLRRRARKAGAQVDEVAAEMVHEADSSGAGTASRCRLLGLVGCTELFDPDGLGLKPQPINSDSANSANREEPQT